MSTNDDMLGNAAERIANEKRDRKGRALANMGHVARTDDGFEVTTSGQRRETLRVWRDLDGRIQCSCPEFDERDDARFRCEHILAVKYYLEPPAEGEFTDEKEAPEMTTTAPESPQDPRDLKARAARLAEEGFVEPSDDGFEVSDDSAVWFVRRNPQTKVVECDCPEFEQKGAGHRCLHILAAAAFKQSLPSEEAADHAPGAPPDVPASFTAVDGNFAELLTVLKQPLPDELIKSRVGWTDRQGNEHNVDYVEWHVVAEILDTVYPPWEHQIVNMMQVGGLFVVCAAITIDGKMRQGIGTGEAVDEKGIKKAEHDALKRAAVKFGVARYLYARGKSHHGAPRKKGSGAVGDPVARSISDLVTPKQLVAIRAIANSSHQDAERMSIERYKCRPEELTKKAASEFIDILKGVRSDDNARRAS